MSEIETGGPAFPFAFTDEGWVSDGMTLRDYFAAKAIAGVMAEERHAEAKRIAAWVYEIADAMLAARSKA